MLTRLTAAIVAGCALMPAASIAQGRSSDCPQARVLFGIENEGMVMCDHADWFDRRGSQILVDRIESCKGEPSAEASALYWSGVADFHDTVKRIGKKAACQALDDVIKAMEEATP